MIFLLGQSGCLIRNGFFSGVNIRRERDMTRVLRFSPAQGEFVTAHYPLKKPLNGFVAGFKAVLLFQAPRYFWPGAMTTAHGPDQFDVFPERARIRLALHLSRLKLCLSLMVSLYLDTRQTSI